MRLTRLCLARERVGGSSAFGNAARSVLLLERDPDDPDREIVPGACAHTFKCDVGLEAPSLLQTVKRIVLPAADGQSEVEPSRLELPGEPSHGGRALLAGAASENERTELEEAVGFLRDLFGDGLGHPAAETFKEARSCGSPITSSKRARKRLGVQDREGWFRPGVAGGFQWLPKMTPRTDTSPFAPFVVFAPFNG